MYWNHGPRHCGVFTRPMMRPGLLTTQPVDADVFFAIKAEGEVEIECPGCG